MSLRIHFGVDDLARTRFATEPDPLWEVLLSLHMLQTDDEPDVYGRWRRRIKSQLEDSDRRLIDLAPAEGYSPDFLTPAESVHGLDAGLQAIVGTPAARLGADLRDLAEDRPLPSWAHALTTPEPDRGTMTRLGGAIRSYHDRALAPFWSSIRRQTSQDLDSRARVVVAGGLAGAAAELHPKIHWRPPVLEVDIGHVDSDLWLDGRGLRLVPSFFCHRHPIALRDTSLQPVLVYPIHHDLTWHQTTTPRDHDHLRALDDLLGSTRAKVLREISRSACSTTELSQRTSISLASASEHARVLHAAGLVQTRRAGRSVQHSISSSGSTLLRNIVS
ncbi:ArsR/SmtB family transcription factor [Luteipulveratus mongoliensis]|uniref:HTH arsR-type domain-containing protein n=1 Tax=Luteipulveratus mongoliensis TaxID=571913 RepID=A0A0K1JIH8_9MICO|nr:winged helix-turn-helix domain-containing protein [Luteipulveratus mongoliensis]AKU16385.1 hypothetical protein VV02_11795 [Luteipulveratus mongoliensis]